MNLAHKLIKEHLLQGEMIPGREIAIRVDQTLTQDATGTLSYLQFEATGVERVKTQLSVSYIDHNMLQADFRNADDHSYLQDVAAKYGIFFSRAGNGICHQVHLERFAVPGASLVGSDSHTPTCGSIGSLAIGAGGLDVAVAMAAATYHMRMPKVLGVELRGSLQPGVTSKDIILEVLRRLSVRGGIGYVLEYHGPGVASLDVPARSTITNMGAELGATTSLFPSDDKTREFMVRQGREVSYRPLSPDPSATYDEVIVIDLDVLEPLIACPDSPDAVVPVSEVAGKPVDQVAIGSCTNSSYADLMDVAEIFKGRTIHPRVSASLSPGSRQALQMIARNGALSDMIASGARVLESACGPCAGIGQVPAHDAVSVRSFNRNFVGRSGDPNNKVYLASPAVCAASAIAGVIADPREYVKDLAASLPEKYLIDDSGIISPAEKPDLVEIRRGPNIKPVPTRPPLQGHLQGEVLIKLGDNISTDDILPAGARTLALRSNVPAISEYVFNYLDKSFVQRCKDKQGGVIVAASNYGQGSSREHAAISPMYLGIKAVLAKSFARIHQNNLVNYGILPLTFASESDYDSMGQGNILKIENVALQVRDNATILTVTDETTGMQFNVNLELTDRQRGVLLLGGLLTSIMHSKGLT